MLLIAKHLYYNLPQKKAPITTISLELSKWTDTLAIYFNMGRDLKSTQKNDRAFLG
jgi:hypothetical protein